MSFIVKLYGTVNTMQPIQIQLPISAEWEFMPAL